MVTNPVLHLDFLKLADEFLWTYHHAPPTRPPYWPRYFLLCHAIELVVKAYLALHGFTQDQLQDNFGHDLKKLLDEADKLGLAISQSARSEIKMLNEAHRRHWARYPRKVSIPVFVIKHFEPSVEELFSAVRSKADVSPP